MHVREHQVLFKCTKISLHNYINFKIVFRLISDVHLIGMFYKIKFAIFEILHYIYIMNIYICYIYNNEHIIYKYTMPYYILSVWNFSFVEITILFTINNNKVNIPVHVQYNGSSSSWEHHIALVCQVTPFFVVLQISENY